MIAFLLKIQLILKMKESDHFYLHNIRNAAFFVKNQDYQIYQKKIHMIRNYGKVKEKTVKQIYFVKDVILNLQLHLLNINRNYTKNVNNVRREINFHMIKSVNAVENHLI